MKLINSILALAIVIIIGGLFMYRANQTKTYMQTQGKLPVITEKDYSNKHLYNNRQPMRATATDTSAINLPPSTGN